MFRNFKTVPFVIFGRGCFSQLNDILKKQRKATGSFIIFMVDDVFTDSHLRERIPLQIQDHLIWINVTDEPKTTYVDQITRSIERLSDDLPAAIIGIGGGSTMDLAKAVSLMLTNPGSSADYQGWDLIQNPAVYHVGIPTLSGTGAEVSRTTVLEGPEKKLGINSDHTVFDQIVLDPELISGAPFEQRFYTGMDCYIHCVESLKGTYLNTFSRSYGDKAIALCREVFLDGDPESDDKLMIASYFGGMSIAYSQVGICHALSYGLAFVLGLHHGIGNCIVFDHLEKYYPEEVSEFHEMVKKHRIKLPKGIMTGVEESRIEKMIDITLVLEPLMENALGPGWRKIMTRSRIREIYEKL
ncbi:MAG: iron-containing alcohol dehydrogenase family protein [Desulfobacterales bacterium]